MRKSSRSFKGKNAAGNHTRGEHKLEFSFSQDRTQWYYKTKSGIWCNITEMNPYGLRYILDRLEKEGHQTWKIYEIVNRELQSRPAENPIRRSA